MTSASKTQRMRNPEWLLTQARFDLLLSLLSPDPAEAGARYERLRGRLIIFFTRRMLFFPEDLADEALNRLTRRLEGGEIIVNVEGYVLGVARHIMQEQFARLEMERKAGEEYSRNNSTQNPTTMQEKEILLEKMTKCLDRLPASDQQLISDYYLPEGISNIVARKRLAQSIGITQAELRKRIFKLRRAMQKCMQARSLSL